MDGSKALARHKKSPVLHGVALHEKFGAEKCIQKYGNFVWALVGNSALSPADAEAVTLEIFRDIWRNAGSFDPATSDEAMFVKEIAARRIIQASWAANNGKKN